MEPGILGALVVSVIKIASEQKGLMWARDLEVLFTMAKKARR